MPQKVSERRIKLDLARQFVNRMIELNENAGKIETSLVLQGLSDEEVEAVLNTALKAGGPAGWIDSSEKAELVNFRNDGVLDILFVDDNLASELGNLLMQEAEGTDPIDWVAKAETRLDEPPEISVVEDRVSSPVNLVGNSGNGQVSLSWDHDILATSYQYQYKRSSVSEWVNWLPSTAGGGIFDSALVTPDVTIAQLVNGESYDFRVRSINSNKILDENKISNASGLISVSPVLGEVRVTAPSNLEAEAGDRQVILTWNFAPDATSYQYRYKQNNIFNWGGWQPIIQPNGDSSLSSNSVIIADLSNGIEYDFQVRSIDPTRIESSNELSTPSNIATTTPEEVEEQISAPLHFFGTGKSTAVDLEWNLVFGADSYQYRFKISTVSDWGNWLPLTLDPGLFNTVLVDNEIEVTGLSNGVQYDFQVRSIDLNKSIQINRLSEPSSQISVTPSSTAIEVPTDLHTLPADGSVNFSWAAVLNVEGYTYRYKLTSSTVWTESSSITDTSVNISGLTNGANYEFQVRSQNISPIFGFEVYSDWSPSITDSPEAIEIRISPPLFINAAVGDGQINLSWTRVSGADSYQYRYKITSASDWGDWLPDTLNPGTNNSTLAALRQEVENLTNGVNYSFQVRSIDIHKVTEANRLSENSTTVTAIPILTAPTPPSITSVVEGDGQATLFWSAVVGANQYKYRYRPNLQGDWVESSYIVLLSAIIINLNNGTIYEFQVLSNNTTGDSEWSPSVQARPVQNQVAFPSSLTASAGSEFVRLSWASVPDASSYQYRFKLAITSTWGDWLPLTINIGTNNSALTGTTVDVLNLTNNSEYNFQVRSIDPTRFVAANRISEPSAISNAIPTAAVPSVPTGLNAETGDSFVDLSWNVSSGATQYDYRFKLTSATNYGSAVEVVLTATRISGLNNGSSYDFQVRAGNSSGDSGWTSKVSATPASAVPDVPTNLSATSGVTQVTLTWNTVGGGATYQYRYKRSNVFDWSTPQNDNSPPQVITGLTANVQYDFQVRATNGDQFSAWTDIVQSTPQAALPSTPSGFSVSAISNGASLSWNSVSNAANYTYRYKLSSVFNWTSTDITATSVTISNLTGGSPYDFQVRANNSAGMSGFTATIQVTPTLEIPATPTSLVSSSLVGGVRLQWTISNGAVSYQVRKKRSNIFNWDTQITATITTVDVFTVRTDITSLTPGVEYDFQVRAVNSSGNSDWSSTSSSFTRLGTPTGLNVSYVAGTVTFSWNAVPGAIRYTGNFIVTGGTINAGTSNLITAGTSISRSITLHSNGQIRFRVRAEVDNIIFGGYSAYYTFTNS